LVASLLRYVAVDFSCFMLFLFCAFLRYVGSSVLRNIYRFYPILSFARCRQVHPSGPSGRLGKRHRKGYPLGSIPTRHSDILGSAQGEHLALMWGHFGRCHSPTKKLEPLDLASKADDSLPLFERYQGMLLDKSSEHMSSVSSASLAALWNPCHTEALMTILLTSTVRTACLCCLWCWCYHCIIVWLHFTTRFTLRNVGGDGAVQALAKMLRGSNECHGRL
jgi:hypothetical protein